jgi:NAD(P)-dependent dehydrogenase (short-subunit alcohol dehydrogenase family)
MKDFGGRVAVITGAGSGFGREFARIGARLGMRLALADVQADALAATVAELQGQGATVFGERTDVARAEDVERLAARTLDTYGAAHLLFNNAGVAVGGLAWENSVRDWEWVLGVNLWGVIHGVKTFVPILLEAARRGEAGHVVNTASVAGLVNPQMMAVYNVSKHAVVSLSETLHHDLRLVGADVGVSVLCPAFVPTRINESARNRPAALAEDAPPTASQAALKSQLDKAVSSGRISAGQVAQATFDAVRDGRFYVLTHENMMPSIELRLQDVVQRRNPTDPFTYKPGVAAKAGPA